MSDFKRMLDSVGWAMDNWQQAEPLILLTILYGSIGSSLLTTAFWLLLWPSVRP